MYKKRPLSKNKLIIFYSSFSSLLDAGLSITDALQIISRNHKKLHSFATQLKNLVLQGKSLTESFIHVQHIHPIDKALIQAAEQTGQLSIFLQQIRDYHYQQCQIQQDIKQALAYPIFICLCAAIMLVGMMIWIIPEFAQIFAQMHYPLPLLTIWVIQCARYTFIILIALLGLGIILSLLIANNLWAREFFLNCCWQSPGLGQLWQWQEWQRFCFTLAFLIKAGLPITNALNIASKTSTYYRAQKALLYVGEQLAAGKTLTDTFRKLSFLSQKYQLVPQELLTFITLGEATGRLDIMLKSAAKELQQNFNRRLQIIMRLLEPIILFILGAAIGLILIALYLPIFNLSHYT